MKDKNNKQKGFIKIILIVVGSLVLLKYIFDFDIVGLLAEGKFKIVLDKIYELGSYGWNKYKDILIKTFEFIFELVKKLIDKF